MITKIGFDVHGVLDSLPAFVAMLHTFVNQPDQYEVHLITGLTRADANNEIGHILDLTSVKYMSIVDHLINTGVAVEWRDGLPYADNKAWNEAKSIYCKTEKIDIMFDDSPTYGEYFTDIDTVYCHIQNTNRVIYETR